MPDDTAAPATIATLGPPAKGQPDTREPDAARQAELRAAYEANVAAGKPPYSGVAIRTLGEVEWILRERDWSGDMLPVGKQRPNLRSADLSLANLSGAQLTGANLCSADLIDANLSDAELYSADLSDARLNSTNLSGANLIQADLSGARLNQANLSGSDLRGANLSSTILIEATMDKATRLAEVTLDAETWLGDIDWQGVTLTRVPAWPRRLGDEQAIAEAKNRRAKNRQWRIAAYRGAARAYRGLSIALRSQGLLIPASNYRLREQVLERKAKLLEFSLFGWVFSWLLFLVAGYGERPVRSFIAYLLVLFGFAGAYFALGSGALGIGTHDAIRSPLSALVFSVTSFHGRGFFPGGGLALDDPITVLAAAEAVIGLFIEIIFIATFTQRFFGGR
jgi:hypothetical protein